MNKILVLSNDSKIKHSFNKHFKENAFYNVIINDNINNLNNYDILVIDYELYINNENIICNNIKIFIIVSNEYDFRVFSNNLNIYYPLFMPICVAYFEQLLNGIYSNYSNNIDLFRYEIIRLFKELGLSFKLSGSRFLYDLLIESLCNCMKINIKMYDYLSMKYKIPHYCIEKNIRYALKVCFDNANNTDIKDKLFGYCCNPDTGVISNLSFIYNIIPEIKYNIYKKELVLKD